MSLGSASNFFLGAASAGGGSEGPIKSVRFNSADSTNLNRTFAAGNRQTFTLSWWMKRCVVDESNKRIFGKSTGSEQFSIMHDSNGRLYTYFNLDSPTDVSTQTFEPQYRDPNAWAHYVLAFDTTQSTDSDRIKFYYNGVQVTDFSGTPNWPTQNASFKWNNASDTYYIGGISTYYINAYLADMYHVDGQQLDCTSFGSFDTNNVWRPASYTGTYGTNGFHLFDFENESTIGHDSSGNENDWTANNLENITSNNTNNVDNVSNITQLQNNGVDQTINLANLRTMMNSSNFQDADTDNSTWGVRVSGASKKFGVKWSNLTGLTGVSVRWQRASTYDADVKTTGTGITESTNTVTSTRSQVTFSTTETSGEILFEDVTSGSTNGFYIRALEFKGYGSVTYPTNAENFVAPGPGQDVLFDVPTNGSADSDTGAGGELSSNYATWNQLIVTTNNTLSEGNLKAVHAASSGWSGNVQQANSAQFVSSLGVSSGKYYWEITVNSGTGSTSIGIVGLPGGHPYYTGYSVNGITEGWGWSGGGTIYHTSGITNDGGTLGSYALDGSSILGFALDMDNGRLYVSNNGVYENSGDPEAGTGYCASGMSGPFWFAASQLSAASATSFTLNTGQRPFAYNAPSNYKCICTTNLPESTIGDGSDYFDVLTWTGDGTGSRSFTGLSFEPDFSWVKIRTQSYTHILFDAVRGAGSNKELAPNSTDAEGGANTAAYGYLSSFDSNGFSSTEGTSDNDFFNRLNDTYVAWNWDAGDSNTSISAGRQNSSLYNKDQVWSTYGTHVGNYFNGIYTWDGVFSASMNFDSAGSLYVSSGTKAKWTLSSSLACNSEFKFYCYNNTTIILNEGLSSEVSSTSTGGGSFHYHTIAFSGNIESVKMDNYSSYLIRLYVDGKALIDSDVTVPDVPAIASTVRANPEAGFSIVSYTGTGTSGDTVEHGLNAVPEFILTKRRDSTGYWPVYHKQLTAGYALQLDATVAEFAGSQLYTNTAPTSSVFSVGNNAVINADGGTYISYCFTGVEGFSKFGSYTGNGNANGTFVFLGFKPALLIIKGYDFASNWFIHDNKRPGYNVNTGPLRIAAEAELGVTTYDLDILSNGFKMRTSGGDSNQNTKNFVYMAWASNPFQANGGLAR